MRFKVNRKFRNNYDLSQLVQDICLRSRPYAHLLLIKKTMNQVFILVSSYGGNGFDNPISFFPN